MLLVRWREGNRNCDCSLKLPVPTGLATTRFTSRCTGWSSRLSISAAQAGHSRTMNPAVCTVSWDKNWDKPRGDTLRHCLPTQSPLLDMWILFLVVYDWDFPRDGGINVL